jgi:hypothetical protein
MPRRVDQLAEFYLDAGHVFELGRPVPVCRNTALILSSARLQRHFAIAPERKHFGLFNCVP